MPVYTVHQPPSREGKSLPDPERFVFVRDGFYFWAFVLPPLWMLLRRQWLVLLGYVLLIAVVGVALFIAHASGNVRLTVMLLIGLLVGFEAATLRRWTLTRRGWKQIGVVVADEEELAERRFFATWVEKRPAPEPRTPPAMPPAMRGTPGPEVIGWSSEPGIPR